jgi:hypothetical protein
MPNVELTATGLGVGASGEKDAFAEMIRTEIAHVVPTARPDVRIGSDDAVAVSVVIDRRDQADVGDVLERLLQEPQIQSSVLDEAS